MKNPKLLINTGILAGTFLVGAGIGKSILEKGKEKSKTNPFIGGMIESVGNITFYGSTYCLFILPFVALEKYTEDK